MSDRLGLEGGDNVGRTANDLKDRVVELEMPVASIQTTLTQIAADIRALRSEFNARMDRQLYWLIGIIVTMILGFGGILFKLASLQP